MRLGDRVVIDQPGWRLWRWQVVPVGPDHGRTGTLVGVDVVPATPWPALVLDAEERSWPLPYCQVRCDVPTCRGDVPGSCGGGEGGQMVLVPCSDLVPAAPPLDGPHTPWPVAADAAADPALETRDDTAEVTHG